jgi:transcriptional regulator with XRE-family HTH domain
MPEPQRPVAIEPDAVQDAKARALYCKILPIRRKKAELSQEQLGEKLGVSAKTIARWEKGEGSLWTGGPGGTIDWPMLRRVAEILRIPLDEIKPRNQYPSAPVDPALRRQWVEQRNRNIRELGTHEESQA